MANSDSNREPSDDRRGPTLGETTRDFVYLLVSVGTALLAFGSVLAAFEGLYSIAVTNAVVAVLLGYFAYHFNRNRRKAAVHNLNLSTTYIFAVTVVMAAGVSLFEAYKVMKAPNLRKE